MLFVVWWVCYGCVMDVMDVYKCVMDQSLWLTEHCDITRFNSDYRKHLVSDTSCFCKGQPSIMKHAAFAGLAIPISDKMVFLMKHHSWKQSETFSSQERFSYSIIKSSAVLMQDNISWYYILQYYDRSKILIIFQNHKGTPYLTLMGELWDVFLNDFLENRPIYSYLYSVE